MGEPHAPAGRNDANVLGWDPNLPGRGRGAKSLGQELAYSGAFAQCQAEKAFRKVCFRSPTTENRIQPRPGHRQRIP